MPADDDELKRGVTPEPEDEGDARVQRLEESLGFAEHTIEQLNEQVLALATRVDQLMRRLAATEARLEKLGESAPEEDPDEA